ncbi:MAG: AGE family epimerase/isomerase, partial [Alphaproteobacteria bacterium]
MDSPAAPLLRTIEDYLFRGLLPLLAEHGWDRQRGGFIERLEADHSPSPLDYRRLTTIGRGLFVFSAAARLRPQAGLEDVAHRAYDYLVRRFWDDRFGGWLFKVDLDGGPLDSAKDLYGHAFAMFGLAHYYRTFRRREALEIARETSRLLKRHL